MQWWNDLDILQRVFFCIAAPATIFLIVQTILVLIGLGADSVDIDTGDVIDGSGEIGIFTMRGIIAFLTIGGWTGVWLGASSLHGVVVVMLAVLAGAGAFVGMVFLMRAIYKMQSEGNVSLENSVGKSAKVYLAIPAKGAGSGKVNLTIQERFVEADAITEHEEKIPTDAMVTIVGLLDENTVKVMPLE